MQNIPDWKIELIELIIKERNRTERVFLCDDDLMECLAARKKVGDLDVKVIRHPDELPHAYSKFAPRGEEKFYVIDSRNLESGDSEEIVTRAKSFIYYEMWNNQVYSAFPKRHYRIDRFNESVKMDGCTLDMTNRYLMNIVLTEIRKHS